MGASQAISSTGTLFQRQDDGSSGEGYTTLGEVNSITGPSKTRETIDVTHLASDGGYREFIPSFRDSGEVSLELNFTVSGYEQFNDDFEDTELHSYQIVLPDSGNYTLTFDAFVIEMGMAIPVGDKVQFSCGLKISGPVTTTT
jgi:predicted secreted protein